ncbi:MAG: DUF1565 domain-containing protein [Candidatus Zixiibacteriota bacterium]
MMLRCGDDDKGPNPIEVPEVTSYYVDAENGSNDNDGTQTAPFKTITRGLQEVKAGDTVIVEPGLYDNTLGETFPIDIPDSVLLLGNPVTQGAGSDSIIISGWGTVNATYSATVTGGDGATISGFFILHQSTTAFHVAVYSSDKNFSVINNTIFSYWGGIYLTGSGNNVVVNNRFRTSQVISYALESSATGTVRIENNNISLSASYAVGISKGTPEVTGNYFAGNYLNGTFRITSDAAPELRNNIFTVISNPAVLITGSAAPDMGLADDPGLNIFIGTGVVSVQCESSEKIYAIGNTWHGDPPVCESEIIVEGDGTVVWGTEVGDSCAAPVSGEFEDDANTVALWHFNTGTGTIFYDATGTGHNGVLGLGENNQPSWEVAGKFGYGLSFDGASEEFALASSLGNDFPSNQFSLEMWVKAPSTPEHVHLWRSDNICVLEMNNLSLTLSVGDGSGTNWKSLSATVLTLTDGNWHYVACTFNGTTLNIFVDGVNYGMNLNAAITMSDPAGYYFGGYPGSLFFTGVLDEVRLSNIARSSTEIATYYDLVSGLK